MRLFVFLGIAVIIVVRGQPMANFQVDDVSQSLSWRLSLSPSWDVLGPFPVHAREQHFLSPSYPLNLSDEIDFTNSYPSSLVDNGSAYWKKFFADPATGKLEVSYPNVRWSRIRQTEGWAGLQHHSVLHTILTIFPPTSPHHDGSPALPRLHVNLLQGSFFTILPRSGGNRAPKWWSGNVYSMENSLSRVIDLPSAPSLTSPTAYDVFVSGDYEIRLFGDPQVYNKNDIPTLCVSLNIHVEIPRRTLERLPSLDVVPDFIGGWAFGGTVGIFLRNHSPDPWVVDGVTLDKDQDGLSVGLLRRTIIRPSQARVIPIEVLQSQPFRQRALEFTVRATSSSSSQLLSASLPVTHLPHWSSDSSPTFHVKSTYFSSNSAPTAFLVKPPLEFSSTPQSPVVALHGAGVDIFGLPFWRDALPRQLRSWTIIPSGRTSWGLDWHGPSSTEVWNCVEALEELLGRKNVPWSSWSLPSNARVVLIGHSNGGQGAWHIAGRFPDRIAAVVPAAGYVKSQAYVPLTQSYSRHFVDPTLNSLLESTLTPDDNDLFLSNMGGISTLVVQGGDDENVPTWHARSLFSTMKSLYPTADIVLKEDSGQPHWYDSVFDNEIVQMFVRKHTSEATARSLDGCNINGMLTLTVAIPAESDTLCGLRIEKLFIPGRLGKLRISKSGHDTIAIDSTNVKQFTMARRRGLPQAISVEGQVMNMGNGKSFVRFSRDGEDTWKTAYPEDTAVDIQPSGRLPLILSSKGPLLFVIPDEDEASLSYALRLAHDLDTFHKLDVEILADSEAVGLLDRGLLGASNIVIFDGPTKTTMGRRLLGGPEPTPLPVRAYRRGAKGNGAIFLYKHPTHPGAVSLFLRADDEIGMENIMRLFPIRTGVFGPDWMVVSPDTEMLGTAGVSGAGLWADGWKYCDTSSWTV